MQQLPFASVIVVSRNELAHIDGCVGNLVAQDYPGPYETILVDNASTDGSAEYVRAHFPEVDLVQCKENLGFAVGNNLGARRARGEILIFLNADTRPDRSWLRELIVPLVADSQVGMTTSKVVLMDRPEIVNTCGNELSLTGITTCRRAGQAASSITRNEEVSAVCGGAFAIWADLFWRLGGFDPIIWPYMEDTDLSWRTRLAGYRCVLAAGSVVAHDYDLKMPPGKVQAIERNRYLMLAKNLSGKSLLALIPHLLVSELLTWGWAALQGPAYLRAKLMAIVWLLTHIPTVIRAHRRTQHLRRVPDEILLRNLPALPAIELVSSDVPGKVTASLIRPIATITSALALRAVSFESPAIATRRMARNSS